ncbi:MAG TPA: 2-phospho-L-lactate transferase CofD family protein, partial [Thermomicrobiales bacterium]|nr:2-phospho-L-lactate transferase CofD family protein [Thermomicrobiales bacterium]
TAYEPALGAILHSDLIVLGPGSLYTSVLPNLYVDGVIEAIRWSKCPVVYVCNVATQPGETDHFGAADHIRAVMDALGPGVLSHAVINSNRAPAQAIKPEWNIQAVIDENLGDIGETIDIVAKDLVSDSNPLRHDPQKLTDALLDIARHAQSNS